MAEMGFFWKVDGLCRRVRSRVELLHIDTTRLRPSPPGSGVPACPTGGGLLSTRHTEITGSDGGLGFTAEKQK